MTSCENQICYFEQALATQYYLQPYAYVSERILTCQVLIKIMKINSEKLTFQFSGGNPKHLKLLYLLHLLQLTARKCNTRWVTYKENYDFFLLIININDRGNELMYEGVSKIFRTCVAIYTAVVVACSTS
jgi:hypothetical protein